MIGQRSGMVAMHDIRISALKTSYCEYLQAIPSTFAFCRIARRVTTESFDYRIVCGVLLLVC